MAQKIAQMDDLRQQSNLSAISAVMGGLSLDKDQVRQVFRREVMKESAIYQEWKQENLAEGREAESRSIALRILAEGISLEVISKITGCSIQQIQS